MKTLTINELESDISSMLMEIEENREIFVICRNGEPIADLIPHKRKTRRLPHPVMSAVRINYDPTEMLSQDEWPEEDQ
ncbi:MAG: type II toxin-antitoxin system prevent-host-death family antitoxin [Desulfobacteraceae bacterium]|jgi:antitoxin (DNA-binding transcriptional repressor) of toxin-antitoxin stability system|nr:type II toxin-antitoxin system prevent-host-death family antitoxin [Desulfobacteraceae bacterium]